jgi:UDP-glucuronate decarboxylase
MSDLVDLILEDAERIVQRVNFAALDGADVLITGASGLIGVQFLAGFRQWSTLNRRPISVTAVCQSAPPPWLDALIQVPGLTMVRGDLTDPAFRAALPSAGVVIHAAGYAQPGRFLADPAKTIQINVNATLDLLEKTRPDGRFLFLSSSEVYSGSPLTPYREDAIGTTDPSHTRACYIEGKRCGEALCHAFRRSGLSVGIGRIALTYGPGTRTDDVRVLNTLIRQGLSEGRIRLRDRGAASRTLGYVSDVAAQLLAVLIGGREAVYNVGGVSRVTILELAEQVGRLLGVPVSVPESDDDPTGAAADVALDLSRVCEEFGLGEFVELDDGLARTVAWQRELYGRG